MGSPRFKIGDIVINQSKHEADKGKIREITGFHKDRYYTSKLLNRKDSIDNGIWRFDHIDELYELYPFYLVDKQFNKDLNKLIEE